MDPRLVAISGCELLDYEIEQRAQAKHAAQIAVIFHIGAPAGRSLAQIDVFTLLPLLTGEGREHHGEIMREAPKLAEAGKLPGIGQAPLFA